MHDYTELLTPFSFMMLMDLFYWLGAAGGRG
jgi:hypothetical protein